MWVKWEWQSGSLPPRHNPAAAAALGETERKIERTIERKIDRKKEVVANPGHLIAGHTAEEILPLVAPPLPLTSKQNLLHHAHRCFQSGRKKGRKDKTTAVEEGRKEVGSEMGMAETATVESRLSWVGVANRGRESHEEE